MAERFENDRAHMSLVTVEPVVWAGEDRVALIGEIDMSNAREVEAALADRTSSGGPLTLDLVGLSYLDTQGVAMIFRLARRAGLNGGTITLANPRGLVRRVLDIMCVAEAVRITEDV
jgi:anti-anti-sigma factor